MFKSQEEDLDDEIHNDQIEQGETHQPIIKSDNHHKEIESKVVYQYPKGNFRFPLIRDEKTVSSRNQREGRKRPERREPVKEVKEKPLSSFSKPVTAAVSKKKEPLPKKGGPFRPTEIPSPVFGFNRPRKTELVEHELTDFFPEDKEIGKQKSIHSDPELKKMQDKVITEESINIQQETYKNVPVQQTTQEIFATEEPVFEEAQFSHEETPNLDETVMAVGTIDEAVMAVETMAEAVMEVEIMDEAVVAEENTDESKIKIEVIEAVEQVNQLSADTSSPEDEKEQSISDGQEKKRPHLPFNVMMLKQDKRKWEERTHGNQRQQSNQLPDKNTNVNHLEKSEPTEKPVNDNLEIIDLSYDPELAKYQIPEIDLLKPPVSDVRDTAWLLNQEEMLNQTLQNFNVGAKVVNVTQGPSVTRFEVQPEPGVKVNKVTNLTDDIKLSLAAKDIRIEAPIPGKHTIGIEVPNQHSRPVLISEIVRTSVFRDSTSPLTAVLGLDISGKPIVTDLKKMPHGLIAGATGSGKSVCINTILVSLLYKATPQELKLLLIDPKMVELAPYNRIPHLVSPVITDVKAATAALKWAVEEMERRYELFAHTGVRDINRFNELAEQHKRHSEKLPFIVIIIDELADLMMMSPADVEEAICRIAQKARACGIHLIIATQRPSVDVITGLIKANVPTRIAFSVSSQIDSRTIIDISGAEKLLGRGDMLFLENGSSKPVRLQGTFVSDEEIDMVVAHAREQLAPDYLFEQEELLKKAQVIEEEDELFYEACEFVIDQGGASTSSLQRRFKVGYNRAARLMDLMEKQGYISGARGSKPREVLITVSELESIQEASTIN
ncbi:MAG: DNA translocase FtsK [Bacillota bacterium]|nr:DNA translocase FtsK [Bacillota bacterium]